MQQTRQALLDHLKTAEQDSEFNSSLKAETIKPYAGEFAKRDAKDVVKLRVDLPAIFVAFDLGQPLADVPQNVISLIFSHDSKFLDKDEGEKDCINFAVEYLNWLYENYRFKDDQYWYQFVDMQNTVLEALLYDQKYTVLGCQLTISVEK